jgi:hypothetical protein
MRHVYTCLPPHDLSRPSFAEGPHFLTRLQLLTSTYALSWAEPRDRPFHRSFAQVQTTYGAVSMSSPTIGHDAELLGA